MSFSGNLVSEQIQDLIDYINSLKTQQNASPIYDKQKSSTDDEKVSESDETNSCSMWDCHAHMCDSQFDNDLSSVLESANDKKISNIICVAENISDCHKLLTLQSKYPNILSFCAGMHPCEANLNELASVVSFIEKNHCKLIGIGECGLDYSVHVVGYKKEEKSKKKNKKSKTNNNFTETKKDEVEEEDEDEEKEEKKREKLIEIQQKVFETQIHLANKYDLPLNVHSRSAGHHTIEFLKQHNAKRVLLHAFDGKPHYAEHAWKNYGYYFSIPPSIARSPQKQKLVKRLPIDALILESDSPALPPVKDTRNEPKNIEISRKFIANIKNMSEYNVALITTKNAQKLFKKMVR